MYEQHKLAVASSLTKYYLLTFFSDIAPLLNDSMQLPTTIFIQRTTVVLKLGSLPWLGIFSVAILDRD